MNSVAVESYKLNAFFDYVIEKWLELDHPHLQTKAWSCIDRRHRTNSVVEVWNHRLNTIVVGEPRP